jgi:hypothetical protein
MPCQFDQHIGIDYSGAGKPTTRSASIQVYCSTDALLPQKILSPASTGDRRRNWCRQEVYNWLADVLQRSISGNQTCIVGMDHGISFPADYFHRYGLKNWEQFLSDFARHWPTDQPDVTVESFRSPSTSSGSKRTGSNNDFRLTEQWTSSAKSVFQFDVNGSVAKSTHAGLPFINRLRFSFKDNLHFWPFDGWVVPDGKSVIAEVFPSLFRNRYARDTRTVDQQDAYAVSRWLQEMDQSDHLERFFHPPLTEAQREQANLEGWILGVY